MYLLQTLHLFLWILLWSFSLLFLLCIPAFIPSNTFIIFFVQFSLSHSFFACVYYFLMLVFNVLYFVPFLGTPYCLFFILSRISFLDHFLFSFGISLAAVTKASVNVFRVQSHLSYLCKHFYSDFKYMWWKDKKQV